VAARLKMETAAQPTESIEEGDTKTRMKITEAKIYLVPAGRHRFCLVKLVTDGGVHGVGEAAMSFGVGATAAAGMVKDLVERIVLGWDPFRIEALWSEMYDHTFWAKGGGPAVFAGMSALEIALWDIKGKALGVPVYELLGGKLRDEVKVYANGWSYGLSSPEEQAQAAERVAAGGYSAIKMYPLASPVGTGPTATLRHVSHRSIDREFEEVAVQRVRAVREAVGPAVELMVDASAELTTDAAIRFGRRLEEFDLVFYEEPVDPFDPEAQKKVAEQVKIPIAAGERHYTRYGFRRMLELHAVDIVQPAPGRSGGLLEIRKIAAMAEAYNARVAPHNCAGPVATAAALQVDACMPNFFMQEVFPFRAPEHYSVVDRAPELEIQAGRLRIPERPGLGVDLVEERVAPHLWARCAL